MLLYTFRIHKSVIKTVHVNGHFGSVVWHLDYIGNFIYFITFYVLQNVTNFGQKNFQKYERRFDISKILNMCKMSV